MSTWEANGAALLERAERLMNRAEGLLSPPTERDANVSAAVSLAAANLLTLYKLKGYGY